MSDFANKLCEVLGLKEFVSLSLDIDVGEIPRLHFTTLLPNSEAVMEHVDLLKDVHLETYYSFRTGVSNCARCGKDHEAVTFYPLDRPCDDWTHYGTCPATGQPIMMLVVESESEEEEESEES